ncbi:MULTISPECIES: DUF805 domain-containing protein [Pantoea]|jgi:uncharacterized membrane protein YhaH (DUF805 family)|uniref:DUF805 domain-containing protein n=1 Tax=Pantoea TaxID=53335 RepID=UPI0008FF21B9|nr:MULTISPECIES: DUF805 domain-containing protein [Pantoea]NIG16960.1 DUF805 domain-containing protein [Pantoea sp. Cy-640]NIG34097.1 DUF805 domain-containing protein [Pantoea sp. Ap-959]PPC68030.1 DUF805 domain-containing protein [Pantoea sp. ICBG 828]
MALTLLLTSIKNGLIKTFDYSGKDSRLCYIIFMMFQIIWFCCYLSVFASSTNEIAWIPLLLFVLPSLACGSRRINDAGYSRGVFILLIVAPYLLFPFLAFPASVKKE